MRDTNSKREDELLFKDLMIDCEKCMGFCCVALYFSQSEGFPMDKTAGPLVLT